MGLHHLRLAGRLPSKLLALAHEVNALPLAESLEPALSACLHMGPNSNQGKRANQHAWV